MKKHLLIGLGLALLTNHVAFDVARAQTAPPPSLGQDTKGEPAQEESVANSPEPAATAPSVEQGSGASENRTSRPFGSTTVKESRRENGQLYRIELQHSSGRSQYIEETDSDGNIESESSDIEDTPNLAKWRIGSW